MKPDLNQCRFQSQTCNKLDWIGLDWIEYPKRFRIARVAVVSQTLTKRCLPFCKWR